MSGLLRYDHAALAATIAYRWMLGVRRVYNASGKMMEKYDVMDIDRLGGGGEYPLQDGFGWTNGVMRKLMVLYSEYAGYTASEQCPTVIHVQSQAFDAPSDAHE